MKQLIKLFSWVLVSLMPLLLLSTPALSQNSPIKINLIADQTEYIQGDLIQIQIRVFNNNLNQTTGMIEPVITREGFFTQDFQHMITFIGPDGKPIKSSYAMIDPEPGPPYRLKGRDTVSAEIIPPDEDNPYVLHDARQYYKLSQFGWYTAQILVPFESFSEYVANPAGGLLVYLDDPERKEFNPLASNQIRFEIVPQEPGVKSSVHAKVSHLKIGEGTKPGATKIPLRNAEVRLIPLSAIPETYYPINWKTYSVIWDYVPHESYRSKLTDQYGIAKFSGVLKDDYLILAQHKVATDFKHMGSPIGADDPNWLTEQPIEKHLMVMEKQDGKKVAGKTTRRKGSDLLITEPEYVEWDSTQESYPFVFETIGDWQVTTSVSPPEGFVADFESLSTEVTSEMDVVQFTITDVGSRWKETKVTYKIKHKGKTEILRSKIGVKLSRKLAKKKGLGPYGHTPSPGPFKGGKKVRHQKQEKKK